MPEAMQLTEQAYSPSSVQDTFLRAICAQPWDTSLRLIYADWLEEHGDTSRAEFIKVQCELSLAHPCENTPSCWSWEHGTVKLCSVCKAVAAMRSRERCLLASYADEWVTPIAELFGLSRWGCAGVTGGSNIPYVTWTFRRGFIEEIHCTLESWERGLDRGAVLLAPITEVSLRSEERRVGKEC